MRSRSCRRKVWVGVAALLASIGTARADPPAKWTVLGYLSGDGSLEPVALEYAQRLAAAPGTASVSVAVQIDRCAGFSTGLGDFEDARRVVFEGSAPDAPRRWKWQDWHTEVDMGDPQTLAEFLAWGAQSLPAERYLVILMGHGSGVRPFLKDESGGQYGVAYDATDGGDSLTPEEFAEWGPVFVEALGGKRIALLAVDACFSASAELAYDVAPFAEFMTGSPDLLYDPGVPWDEGLRALCAAPGMSAEDVAGLAVETVRASQAATGHPQGCYAAAKLAGSAEFATAIRALSEELRRGIQDAAPMVTAARAEAARGGLSGEMLDAKGFLQALSEGAEPGRAGELAEAAERALDEMVVASYSGEVEGQAGATWTWSVFFPPNLTAFPQDYLETGSFARESGWGAFLEAYLGRLQELLWGN